ncbi:MAG: HEPN domain-containing protein [Dehalococcoidia bacterium]|nr:HEPN domain-containing protein [Dehalococcoidia bacterium]
MGQTEAERHLKLAKEQLERVQTASWEPQEPEVAVIWSFYAYENGVVAIAEKLGIKWEKTHASKVTIATRLYKTGKLSVDVGPTIAELNELRKDVQYGEPGPELQAIDMEDLATSLENFITEVENVVTKGN